MSPGGRGWLLAAVAAWLLLAPGWAVLIPAWEPSDEATHVQYALHLAQGHGLPVVRGTSQDLGLPWWTEQTQAYQPPLYFWLAGQAFRALGHADSLVALRVNPWRGRPEGGAARPLNYLHGLDEAWPFGPGQRVLLALRGLSVLLGLGVVLLAFALGRRAWPGDPAVAGVGALLVACLPRFLHEAGSVHNETLSTALAHLALVLLLGWNPGRPRPLHAALLGLVIGLGLLAKLTCLFLLPLAALALLRPCLGERRWPRAGEWACGLLVLVLAAATGGWWYAHNLRAYGDPFALGPQRELFWTMAISPGRALDWLTGPFLRGFLGSLVGDFGWGAVPVHPAAAAGALLLAGFALAGAWLARGRPGPAVAPETRARRALLGWAVALVLAQFLVYNTRVTGPDSRYVFGALGPAAVLLAAGLVGGWRALAARAPRVAGVLALLLLGGLPAGSAALLLQASAALDATAAPSGRFHANLVLGVGSVPGRPAVALLDPPDGAVLDEPPVLRWDGSVRRDADVPWAIDFCLAPGQPLLALYDTFDFGVFGDRLEVPDELWQRLPAGRPVLWRVRLLPDRERGESELDAPSSGFRAFTRAGG